MPETKKMDAPMRSQPENILIDLANYLSDENGLVRQRARLMLVHLGQSSIPVVLEALKSKNTDVRVEAVKTLGEFRDPEVIPPLITMLTDDQAVVRWAAAEGLIRQGRAGLRPLLEEYIRNFDSPWLREGFHHILHVFWDRDQLTREEIVLFRELDKQDFSGINTGWTGQSAWAAEKALEAYDREGDAK
jgi:HEAT repeats